MQLTKEIFDRIKSDEIFRTVTTKIHPHNDPYTAELTYVCVKGKNGIDWVIYCSLSGGQAWDIARYGNKITSEETIRNICPCDDEVFKLYRH